MKKYQYITFSVGDLLLFKEQLSIEVNPTILIDYLCGLLKYFDVELKAEYLGYFDKPEMKKIDGHYLYDAIKMLEKYEREKNEKI